MTTPTPTRRRLHEHIGDGILALCADLLAEFADDEHGRAVRERLARWAETAHESVTVELVADRQRRGRPDPRSLRAVVRYVARPGGPSLGGVPVDPVIPVVGSVVLCRPLVRDLVDGDGLRIDARTTYAELIHQQAEAWPDTVPDVWPAEPSHPGVDREARARLLAEREALGWPERWSRDGDDDRALGDDRPQLDEGQADDEDGGRG